MVNNDSQRELDRIFHALSDATRREILNRLAHGQYTIGELAEPFKMSLPAVSKHIKVLEEAGLLTRAVDGRIHRCAMNGQPLKKAQDIIGFYQEFWANQFRSLDRYLQESIKSNENDNEDKKDTDEKGDEHGNRKK